MLTPATIQRALWVAIVVAVVGLLVPLERAPVNEVDTQLYGSIARSVQLYGDGLPTSLRMSPVAVDHLPFYGPVFFNAAATAFQFLGVSKFSIRLVSLAGALLIALAGGVLAKHLAQRPSAALWAIALLLFAPDLRSTASNGSMQTLAVGLELAALAVWVRGAVTGSTPLLHGGATGLLLGAAALTTPRTFPFVAAFFLASVVVECLPGRNGGRNRPALGMAAIGFAGVIAWWGTIALGSPVEWIRYMAYIFTHEDTDIAFVSSQHLWLPRAPALVTPFVAMVGTIGVALAMRRRPNPALSAGHQAALEGVLLTGWITLVLMMAGMNRTFESGIYFSVPLLAGVIAIPYERLGLSRRTVRGFVAVTAMTFLAVAAAKSLRVASTWSARDPQALFAFVDHYTNPGDIVVGSGASYFFSVERSGAVYRSADTASFADWTRWVPKMRPEAVTSPAARRHRGRPSNAPGRFLVWAADEGLPPGYECAAGHVVGRYDPPADDLSLPDLLATAERIPATLLFKLPDGCPTGYDPTRAGAPADGTN